MIDIVYDIETVMDWEVSDELMQRLAGKGAGKRNFNSTQEKLAFSPLANRIVCIGSQPVDIGVKTQAVPSIFIGELEEEILRQWVSLFNGVSEYRLIGFNSQSFDYPNILFKLAKYQIQLPPYFPINQKYGGREKFHIDLRAHITNYQDFATGNLEDWCCRHGMQFEDFGGGDDVQTWWNDPEQRWKIERHCKQDLELTGQLYLKHKDYLHLQ